MALPDHDHECFLISPIGDEGSAIRERADGVRDFIVRPAVEALRLQLRVVRADDIAKPGQITLDVIDHVLKAKVAVADLTGLNANVFYELAVRHAAKLPVVLIAHEGQLEKGLPFDLQQMRTIPYDDASLKKAAEAKATITEHLQAALEGAVDSPLSAAVNLDALRSGDVGQQAIAGVMDALRTLYLQQQEVLTRVVELHGAAATLTDEDRRWATHGVQPRRPRKFSLKVHEVEAPHGKVAVTVEPQPEGGFRVEAQRAGTTLSYSSDSEDISAILNEAAAKIEFEYLRDEFEPDED